MVMVLHILTGNCKRLNSELDKEGIKTVAARLTFGIGMSSQNHHTILEKERISPNVDV